MTLEVLRLYGSIPNLQLRQLTIRSQERLGDRIVTVLVLLPFPNAVFLRRLPTPSATTPNNQVAGSVIGVVLHALNGRVVDLCIFWNVSGFTHGRRPVWMSVHAAVMMFANVPLDHFPATVRLQIHSSERQVL